MIHTIREIGEFLLSIVSRLNCGGIILPFLVVVGICCPQGASAGFLENAQVSGGVDGRGYWIERSKPDTELYGAFLNYRKVFSDDLGDRWILSLQGDAEHNFKEIRSYQSFLQYKGPLGKWNVRAGHFILPLGLLSDFDTERMLLQSEEKKTTGIKLDTGVSAFGFVDDWNWSISLTSGLGRRWINEYKNTYLTILRASRKLDDLTLGTSLLVGEIRPDEDFPIHGEKVRHQKIVFDGVYDFGQWIARLELLFGQEQEKRMGAAQGFFDYQFSNQWELNLKGSSIFRTESEQEIGAGFSFKPWTGWIFRTANLYRFKPERNENEFRIQLAYQFSRGL